MSSRLASLAVAVTLLLLRAAAVAAPLELSATPILGAGAPCEAGWCGYSVSARNTSGGTVTGFVELVDGRGSKASSPLSLGAGEQATFELSWHDLFGTELSVRATDDSGKTLVKETLAMPRGREPLLVDLNVPSRLAPVLRGQIVSVGFSPPAMGYGHDLTLSVTSPQIAPKTGDPVLPRRAANYGSATLLVAGSAQLAALGDAELSALSDWLLSGGSIAVSVTRPEDLRSQPLATWLGSAVRPEAPHPELRSRATFQYKTEGGNAVTKTLTPSETTLPRLRAYAGGNLRPTRWGVAATYGLGEVHLLPIDPATPSFVSDEWVRLTVLDLVRHAWDRRAQLGIPYAATGLIDYRLTEIRRLLDPNEGARWAVVVCALALVLYALLAGPVNFYRARRRGRPLSALVHLPLFSGGALAFVVVTGVFAKGIEGRSRRLSLVEAGAGMTRAAATRFRAFYASSSTELTVRPLDADAILDVTSNADDTARVLLTDRSSVRLEGVVARPWETLIVREDGFASLGGGITLLPAEGDDVLVKNRSARTLRGVVVAVPGGSLRYFPTLRDGEAVRASAGNVLGSVAPSVAPVGVLHPLAAYNFAPHIEKSFDGLGSAWLAVDALASGNADWWPQDVPVLLAELEGGDGKSSDSGLRLEVDRVLVRVVGFGGAP